MLTNTEIEKKMVDLRINELALRDQVVEQIHEIHKRELWKGLGYKTLAEFCAKHLGYEQEELREIMIEMGEIIPSDRLIAADPIVQKRIEYLRNWRRDRAKRENISAYLVFSNRTLLALANRNPKSKGELLSVNGIGERKVGWFGDELIADLAKFERAIVKQASISAS